MQRDDQYDALKKFYNGEYYGENPQVGRLSWHYKTIAERLEPLRSKSILDVACGTGDWLAHLQSRGAAVSGIDISEKAIEVCKQRFRDGSQFFTSPAEELPFPDATFDLITCMGSLEHFVDPVTAIREMVRVSRKGAQFLLLVPNSGFLPRRLGLYGGTQQIRVREDVRSLNEWSKLFSAGGLSVKARWRDLHVLTWSWITAGGGLRVPMRALQAVSLLCWPLMWQYQVYHLCEKSASV